MILSDSIKSPKLHSKYYQCVALGIEFPTQENPGLIEIIATEVSERIQSERKAMKICFFYRHEQTFVESQWDTDDNQTNNPRQV